MGDPKNNFEGELKQDFKRDLIRLFMRDFTRRTSRGLHLKGIHLERRNHVGTFLPARANIEPQHKPPIPLPMIITSYLFIKN